MLVIIIIATLMTVFSISYLVLANISPQRTEVAERLKALDAVAANRGPVDEDLAKPFVQRIIAPLSGSLADKITRLTPSAVRRMIEEKISIAGGFSGLTTDGFLLLCGCAAVAGAMMVGALAAVSGAILSKIISLMIIGFSVGLMLPLFLLNYKIAARKANIQRDLPDVLDMITISVEAGLAFDGALAKLSEKMKGVLVDEFGRMLQEMRIGVPRRSALHSLAKRCAVPDLSVFTASLIQADQLGVSIGNVLRIQSVVMREKRRQRAKEKAQMAPVKMLLPLVIFIFPAIFVILIGPAAINIIAAFSQK